MLDWVGLLLRTVLLYSKAIGVTNFEFDWSSGRVFTTSLSTLYATVVNFIVVTLLGYQFTGSSRLFGNVSKLHEYVIIVLTVLRIIAGLITLLNRWRQRCQLMKLTSRFIRLFLSRPEALRISRWAILGKFLVASLTDFLQIAISLEAIGRVDSTLFLGMGLQFYLSAILNLAIAQHFLVMLFVRTDYQLLIRELRQVIGESKGLSYHQQRKGAFMTRCCDLADQVEDIARRQNELNSIVDQLHEIFGIQGLMVYVGYYISVVSTTYLTYSVFKYGYTDMGLTHRSVFLALTWCFFYYLDAILNFFTTLSVLDGHKELVRLMEDRTLFAIGLDIRLEQSFESLQLQLARNPLRMQIMKMCTISHSGTLAMFGSLVTHSIILIQYDMENF
ncbi:putative gustatory receptor 36c [Drosophila kikkawai]|uniref:Gustatory receptor n=1 Tax=Drosophila kikkawai TaxID=30033 RepID=A0A6P4IPF5_DROKI|nr:putative gustatory receptor 36c [Drosophila kikkawai]